MTFPAIHWCKLLAATALLMACMPLAEAQEQRRLYTPAALDSVHAVQAEHGMVVAQEKLATQIGADILRQGGNAVDAAIANGIALTVTYPRAGNIGGGGFMVIHSAERGQDVAIDYRETAPSAMTRDIFLGSDGKPDPAKSRDSALGIGVPGWNRLGSSRKRSNHSRRIRPGTRRRSVATAPGSGSPYFWPFG